MKPIGPRGSLQDARGSTRGPTSKPSHCLRPSMTSHTARKSQILTVKTSPFGPHTSLLATAMPTIRKTNAAIITNALTSTPARTATGTILCTAPATRETPTGLTAPDTPPRTTQPNPLPSPVDPARLSNLLEGYEHQAYIIDGFKHGFSMNYQGPDKSLTSSNSHSVQKLPHIVQEKLHHEIKLGRIAGPFSEPPFKNFKSSPIALREKSTPGKYRLLHLSFPYDQIQSTTTLINHPPKSYTTPSKMPST